MTSTSSARFGSELTRGQGPREVTPKGGQVIEEKAQCLETAVREEAKDIKDQLGEVHQSIDRLSSSAGGSQAAGGQ